MDLQSSHMQMQLLNRHLGITVVEEGVKEAVEDSFKGIIFITFATWDAQCIELKKQSCATFSIMDPNKLSHV